MVVPLRPELSRWADKYFELVQKGKMYSDITRDEKSGTITFILTSEGQELAKEAEKLNIDMEKLIQKHLSRGLLEKTDGAIITTKGEEREGNRRMKT